MYEVEVLDLKLIVEMHNQKIFLQTAPPTYELASEEALLRSLPFILVPTISVLFI